MIKFFTNIFQSSLAAIYAFRVVGNLSKNFQNINADECPELIAFISKARRSGWNVNKCLKNLVIQFKEIDRYSLTHNENLNANRRKILKVLLNDWDNSQEIFL